MSSFSMFTFDGIDPSMSKQITSPSYATQFMGHSLTSKPPESSRKQLETVLSSVPSTTKLSQMKNNNLFQSQYFRSFPGSESKERDADDDEPLSDLDEPEDIAKEWQIASTRLEKGDKREEYEREKNIQKYIDDSRVTMKAMSEQGRAINRAMKYNPYPEIKSSLTQLSCGIELKPITTTENEIMNAEMEVMKMIILREQLLERLKLLFDTTEMTYSNILNDPENKQCGAWKDTIRFSHNEFRVLFSSIQTASMKVIEAIRVWRRKWKQFDKTRLREDEIHIYTLKDNTDYIIKMRNDLDFIDNSIILPLWIGFPLTNNPMLLKPDYIQFRAIWDKTRTEALQNYRNEYLVEYKNLNNIPQSTELTKFPYPDESNPSIIYPKWLPEIRLDIDFPPQTYPNKPIIEGLNPFLSHKARADQQYILDEEELVIEYNDHLSRINKNVSTKPDPLEKYLPILNNDTYDASFPVPTPEYDSNNLKERQEQGVFITELSSSYSSSSLPPIDRRCNNNTPIVLAPQNRPCEVPLKVNLKKLRQKIAERNKKYAKITSFQIKGKMMGFILKSSVTVLKEKRRDDNIILIQSVYRGYRVRRQYRLNKITQRNLLQNDSSLKILHLGRGIVANPDENEIVDDEEDGDLLKKYKNEILSTIDSLSCLENMKPLQSDNEKKYIEITTVVPPPDGYDEKFYEVVKEGALALASSEKVRSKYHNHCSRKEEETKRNNDIMLRIYQASLDPV